MSVKINEFPSVTERTRITTLRKYQMLYANEQFAVLGIHELIKKHYKNLKDLIYLAHAIPARITEFYGDFVQGDVDALIIRANTESQDDIKFVEDVVFENDLKESISDYAEDQSQYGYAVFLGWTDNDDNYHIDSVPADQYFPQADGSVIFATYKKDPADEDQKKLLLHTQHYQKDESGVFVEHQAFRTNNLGVGIEEYPLESMSKLVGRTLEAKETIEGVDEIPVRQADNGRKTRWGFGKSDYHDILPQLAEINERTTHVSTVFLKNIDAKMVVPAASLSEDEKTGEVKLRQQDVYITETKEDMIPQYITNTNPLLADMREHVAGEMKMIEWVTGVPMWAITKGGGQAEKVESLRIQLFSAERKSLKKRAKIKRALLDMFRFGAQMTSQSKELQENDIIIDFGDVLPVDEMSQVESESVKITSGFSSKRSSMMRVENYSEEEADEELEQIKNEDAIAGIGEAAEAPTV